MKFTHFTFSIEIKKKKSIETREITSRARSKRGKVPRASSLKIKSDIKQHLDVTETESMPLEIQTNFLSESVRKYLELGRAIPGTIIFTKLSIYYS